MKEAAHYEAAEDGKVLCRLCPHGCTIAEGRTGRCGVRENRGGVLVAATYAEVTSVAMDPIEKKPLYHFHPGESILSLGGRGCNFSCSFCQNWGISQSRDVPTRRLESSEAVQLALKKRSIGIAFTYNEPLIWFEYVLDTARAAREKGLVNVLVTNGYVNPEPLAELLPFVDALNMDIKSVRPQFYEGLCGGTLEPVLASARAAARATHLEVTNLIIPGHNDGDADLSELARWIADELGPGTPTHLSAYFPHYRLEAPPTPVATLDGAYGIFRQRLQHVYLGNVRSSVGSSTVCHQCGAELIRRSGYSTSVEGLDGPKCRHCGAENNIVA